MRHLVLALLAVGLFSLPLMAEEAAKADAGPQTLEEAIMGGKLDFNLRLRAETVDQDKTDEARAFTSRLRLGYGTLEYKGFSGYLDFEDIRTADDDRYNAAGTNSNPGKAVVADPEATELNQAYLKYNRDWAQFIVGRQRIILDDARFVGNVGWRQNEQTFDAATFSGSPIENWDFFYTHIQDVRRVFGQGSGSGATNDFESDSHVINVSYNEIPRIGKITAFALLLDFDNAVTSSSDTLGLRLTGATKLSEKCNLKHVVSWATQSDAGDNTDSYDAGYLLAEGTLEKKECGNVGAGYEVLGSDSGDGSFQTPLATGHKFNGFADVFLTTPDDGLKDFYIFAGTTLPCDTKVKVACHWFRSESAGRNYGEEIDLVASKSLSEQTTVLAKLAFFDGNVNSGTGLNNRTKGIIQCEYKF